MTIPRRIQQSREKGWRMPEGAVSVARPGKWGNPFRIGGTLDLTDHIGSSARHPGKIQISRDLAIALYTSWIMQRPDLIQRIRAELAGKPLACFCGVGDRCHADVLLMIANS